MTGGAQPGEQAAGGGSSRLARRRVSTRSWVGQGGGDVQVEVWVREREWKPGLVLVLVLVLVLDAVKEEEVGPHDEAQSSRCRQGGEKDRVELARESVTDASSGRSLNLP